MNRTLALSLVVLSFLGCNGPEGAVAFQAASPASPSAVAVRPSDKSLEDLLKRYAEARGGHDRLTAVNTVRMKGRMNGIKGIKDAPITIEKKREGGRYMRRLETGGIVAIQAVDGPLAWEVSPATGVPKPRPMPESESRRFRHWTDIEGPLVGGKAKGHQIELVGIQKLDSGDAYRLKVQYKDGAVGFFLLDAKSFLPVQVVDLAERRGEVIEVNTVYGDFRKVGGVVWPFSERTELPNLHQEITWQQIEVNVPIEDADFKMPQ
jgi:zinc protease